MSEGIPWDGTETQKACRVDTENWSDVSVSQGVPKVASKPSPEARKSQGRVLPRVSEEA